MKNTLLYLLILLSFVGCTTSEVLESDNDTIEFGGVTTPVAYEKVKYSFRSIFSERRTFDFGFEVKLNKFKKDDVLFVQAINENDELDAHVKRLDYRKLKKNQLVLLSYDKKIVSAIYFIAKHPLIALRSDGYSKKTPTELFGTENIKKVVPKSVPTAREFFKTELENGNNFDGEALVILNELSVKDPLQLTAADIVLVHPNFKEYDGKTSPLMQTYVRKMAGNKKWVKRALQAVFEYDTKDIDVGLIYAIGGSKVIDSLDQLNTTDGSSLAALTYIENRLANNVAPISARSKSEFSKLLAINLQNPCEAFSDRDIPMKSLILFRKLGNKNGETTLALALKNAGCKIRVLVPLAEGLQWNEDNLTASEIKVLVAFLGEHLGLLEPFDQRWAYNAVEKFLTPKQEQDWKRRYPALES